MRTLRRLFAVGRIAPQRPPAPCTHEHHAGPFRRRVDLDQWQREIDAQLGSPAHRGAYYDCMACKSSKVFPLRKVAA